MITTARLVYSHRTRTSFSLLCLSWKRASIWNCDGSSLGVAPITLILGWLPPGEVDDDDATGAPSDKLFGTSNKALEDGLFLLVKDIVRLKMLLTLSMLEANLAECLFVGALFVYM